MMIIILDFFVDNKVIRTNDKFIISVWNKFIAFSQVTTQPANVCP